MKHIAYLLLILAVPNVHADCLDTWLTTGWSSERYLSIDYSEGCYDGSLIINFTNTPRSSPKAHWKSIPFDHECTTSNGEREAAKRFSCRKDGDSPLAGATYQYEEAKANGHCEDGSTPLPDRFYRCIHGCGSNTPTVLFYEYSEGGC